MNKCELLCELKILIDQMESESDKSLIENLIDKGSSYKKPDYIRRQIMATKGKPVRCVETGKIFISTGDAANHMNLVPQNVSSAVRRGGACGGYHFEYI